MLKKLIVPAVLILAGGFQNAFGQTPSPTPKISEIVSKSLARAVDKTAVPREQRAEAYAKLLEGQRFIWNANPQRSRFQNVMKSAAEQARQSLLKAIELDPTLAEAYTALAELSSSVPPGDIDEAIFLANAAVKLEKNNFGAHQLLARLYTAKSGLNRGILDSEQTQKAITEWNEVARLDPRNAEAYAFLSEFYLRTKKPEENINALRKWVGAAQPVSSGMYGRVFPNETLLPENGSLKLARALIKAKQPREAIEILSLLIADNPDNEEAVNLLQEAVESDESSALIAAQALQQAVFANPENVALTVLLAQTQAKNGKPDESAKILRDASAKLAEKDKNAAAYLQVVLGDIYVGQNRVDDGVKAFQNALTVRGISETEAVTDDERDFAIRVFDKIIETYKKANRLSEAKSTIERARTVLGKNDLFADKKLISFYRDTGKSAEALKSIRALRVANADDYSLLRLEATTLNDLGKTDEAVTLVKNLIGKKTSAPNSSNITANGETRLRIGSPMYDDFSNYIFISNLYSQAKRGKDAVEAVNQAITAAQSSDRREIGKLTLATVQQSAGDFQGAETTLRDIIKNSPQNPIALNNLGYFLAERGEKLDEALNLIKKALEISPNNPSYLDSLGWTYFKLGRFDEAEQNLKNALRYDDSSSTIQEHLGDVYQKQGKAELAKSFWQKALELAVETEDSTRLKFKLNAPSQK